VLNKAIGASLGSMWLIFNVGFRKPFLGLKVSAAYAPHFNQAWVYSSIHVFSVYAKH
jgi:hypothetical protein